MVSSLAVVVVAHPAGMLVEGSTPPWRPLPVELGAVFQKALGSEVKSRTGGRGVPAARGISSAPLTLVCCPAQYREERFRLTSESTNQRVLWWSIAQTVILILTGIWQMRHLKSFFEAKKLV